MWSWAQGVGCLVSGSGLSKSLLGIPCNRAYRLTEEFTEGFVDETPMQECRPSVVVLGRKVRKVWTKEYEGIAALNGFSSNSWLLPTSSLPQKTSDGAIRSPKPDPEFGQLIAGISPNCGFFS